MGKAEWKYYIFENGSLSDEQRRAAIGAAEDLTSGTEGASFHLPPRYTEVVDGTSTERTTKAALVFTALKLLSCDPEDKVVFSGNLCWLGDNAPIGQCRVVLTVCGHKGKEGPDAIADTDHYGAMQRHNATTTPKSAL